MNTTIDKKPISKEAQRLVIERLKQIPDNIKLSVGSAGEFSKADLIQHVKDGDAIGATVIDSQLRFLRALGTGTLLNELVNENF
ncbi:MAG: hypothetical protein Q8P93_02145 [bacterium]|nr:hypothetical protein [bacterium]